LGEKKRKERRGRTYRSGERAGAARISGRAAAGGAEEEEEEGCAPPRLSGGRDGGGGRRRKRGVEAWARR